MDSNNQKKTKSLVFSFFAGISISLSDSTQWIEEKYKKVPANENTFSSEGLKVKVNSSASPLIYKFDSPKEIKSFSISGHLSDILNIVKKQGAKKSDDFSLRIGFVLPGVNKLTKLEKWMAPNWVVRLYSLVPTNSGLDKIVFYNMVQDKTILGSERVHPLSEYIYEKFTYLKTAAGDFHWKENFKSELTAAAIWISIDGDDTGSSYQMHLKEFNLNLL